MNKQLILICITCLLSIVAAMSSAKPLIGVYYFPGWYRGDGNPSDQSSEWRNAIMKAATPRAACGFYNDSDPGLWNYYIPWMATHGLDFIAFDWYYNAGQDYLEQSLERGYLQSPRCKDIKFCIHWCNHGGPWFHKPLDQTKPAVLEMTDKLCDRYFGRPNYLRIDDRPVFMIYDMNMLLSFGGVDAVRESLASMRLRAKEKGLPGLYLVGVYSGSSPEYIGMLKTLGFDAFCAYTYAWMRPPSVCFDTRAVPYSDSAEMIADYLYPYLAKVGLEERLPYWPSTFSGWDDRPRAGLEKAFVNTGSTPEAFARMFRGALKNTSPSSPVVMVEAWNEWGEGACIEPSEEHGFGYLKAIAGVLGKTSPNEKLPTPDETASWSVLTPEELKVAKENESKPWPLPEPNRYKLGKSFDVPQVSMPYVFDLASGGIAETSLGLAQMAVQERTADGTWFETTGGDPGIWLPEVRIPMKQIKRIAIEGEMPPGPAEKPDQRRMEVFWTTGLRPEFTQFASTGQGWSSTNRTVIQVADIPWWSATGTPLTRLRIDPCSAPGIRFRIRRVILSEE